MFGWLYFETVPGDFTRYRVFVFGHPTFSFAHEGFVGHPSDRANAIRYGLAGLKSEAAGLTDLDDPNFEAIGSGPPLVRVGTNDNGMRPGRKHFLERLDVLRFHRRVQPQQKRAQFFARDNLGHRAS